MNQNARWNSEIHCCVWLCTYIIYFIIIIIVDEAKPIHTFRHFANVPNKARYSVITRDRTLVDVYEMLLSCYYSSRAGVEEEHSSVLEYGATYWGKWRLAFRATTSKLINNSFNSLLLKTKTRRYFLTQQTAPGEELCISEDLNLQVVTNWSRRRQWGTV